MLYDLNNEEMKIVKELIEYTNMIANMYNKLYELELRGVSNSCELNKKSNLYDDIIGFILDIKGKENQLYMKINDKLKFLDYFNYLYNLTSNTEFDNKTIFENDNYVIERIIVKLEYLIGDDEFENSKLLDFLYQFENDIFNLGVIFADEIAANYNDQNLIYEIKKEKYIHAFFTPKIENSFLLSNFDLDQNLIDINKYERIEYINTIAYEEVKKTITYLTKNDNNKILSIKYLSILKAYLLFLNKKDIKRLIIRTDKETKIEVKTKIIELLKNSFNN